MFIVLSKIFFFLAALKCYVFVLCSNCYIWKHVPSLDLAAGMKGQTTARTIIIVEAMFCLRGKVKKNDINYITLSCQALMFSLSLFKFNMPVFPVPGCSNICKPTRAFFVFVWKDLHCGLYVVHSRLCHFNYVNTALVELSTLF